MWSPNKTAGRELEQDKPQLRDWLTTATKDLCLEAEKRVWAETREHVRLRQAEFEEGGMPKEAALREAVRELGSPKAAASEYCTTNLTYDEYTLAQCFCAMPCLEEKGLLSHVLESVLAVAFLVGFALLIAILPPLFAFLVVYFALTLSDETEGYPMRVASRLISLHMPLLGLYIGQAYLALLAACVAYGGAKWGNSGDWKTPAPIAFTLLLLLFKTIRIARLTRKLARVDRPSSIDNTTTFSGVGS